MGNRRQLVFDVVLWVFGHFRRNRRGEVTGFVYYEFGKRLGVARRLRGSSRAE